MSIFLNFLATIVFFLLYQTCDIQNISAVAIIGIIQYVWMISSWYSVTKNVINVYLLFLVLSFAFYLGQPVLYLFGVHVTRIMTIETAPFTLTQINTTLILLLRAMSLFHLGAMFSVKKIQKKSDGISNKKSMVFAGTFLFIISVIPQLNFTITSLKTMLTVGYSGIFNSDYLTGTGVDGGIPRVLAGFFKPALLLLILGNQDNNQRRRFWFGFAVIFSLIMMISGQRGDNALFLVGLALLYHYSIKQFSKRQILNFVWLSVICLIAFSIISNVRNVGLGTHSFGDIVSKLSNMNFFTDILAETGYTLLACTTVVVYTPYTVPFNHGATYFNSLYSLVPNLFWDVNPSAVGSVDQVFHHFLSQYGGIGSSFIIEGYYNFGNYCLILMPIFGFLLGKLYFSMVQSSLDENYLKLYISIYLSTFVLWYVRSDTVSFWRDFGYYAIFPTMLAMMYYKYAKKTSRKRVNIGIQHFSK